ncbi:MAG: acyl carrier protein [Gallionella sp.]|nr:acyl carrier protein [Gallionella sp.]
MSDTLEKLQTILIEQLGIPAAEIDPDIPLHDIMMDAVSLEEFRFLIEENYNIYLPAVVEDCCDTETSERDVHNLTLRQISNVIDKWFDLSRETKG